MECNLQLTNAAPKYLCVLHNGANGKGRQLEKVEHSSQTIDLKIHATCNAKLKWPKVVRFCTMTKSALYNSAGLLYAQ